LAKFFQNVEPWKILVLRGKRGESVEDEKGGGRNLRPGKKSVGPIDGYCTKHSHKNEQRSKRVLQMTCEDERVSAKRSRKRRDQISKNLQELGLTETNTRIPEVRRGKAGSKSRGAGQGVKQWRKEHGI